MATITKTVATFENGNIEFQIDYDDVTLRLETVRCINNSDHSAYGNVMRVSDGLSFDHTFPAHTTQFFDIPNNPSQRFTFTLRPDGKLDGVEYYLSG